ncbi:6-phosphogluconolactonase [Sediminicola luteus]|uniref:6-phosphogluconolactonase n=1 Tax=Sediminicola luteus TaxID=319238 RepID=A0ABV2TSC9_9FLAO
MELKIYTSKEEVAKRFSEYLVKITDSKEEVHIALSGGSTPKIVFDMLASEYGTDINWDNVHFYWGDERCVPPTHEESNYKMTLNHLFEKISIPAANIHRIQGEDDPAQEAKRYAQLLDDKLPKRKKTPQFDLVILGMGDDGHTASIFPHEIELWDAKANCAVAIHPDSGQRRITITGKIINNAKEVAFLVTGAGKAEKVEEIMKKEGDYANYPATLVAPTSGQLIWFLDSDAAKGLMSVGD